MIARKKVYVFLGEEAIGSYGSEEEAWRSLGLEPPDEDSAYVVDESVLTVCSSKEECEEFLEYEDLPFKNLEQGYSVESIHFVELIPCKEQPVCSAYIVVLAP